MERKEAMFESKEICELVSIENDQDFNDFIKTNPKGLAMLPEKLPYSDKLAMKSDAGDFAKWLQTNSSALNVAIKPADQRFVLRSGDYWLPLVFLANDISLPIYLNLVSSYIYEKMKGSLKGEKLRVHLSAEYQDQQNGIVKRFNFEGDVDTLQKTIKKFDLNKFLD